MFTFATRQASRLVAFNFFSVPICCTLRNVTLEKVDQSYMPSKTATPINRKPLHELSPRMHGTVTAFKHRRGYGFILAEGYLQSRVDDNKLSSKETEKVTEMETNSLESSTKHANTPEHGVSTPGEVYFFVRKSLNGGFYLTEGERVSFNVIDVRPEMEKCSSNDGFEKHTTVEMQCNDNESNRVTESSELAKRSFNVNDSTRSLFSIASYNTKSLKNSSGSELEGSITNSCDMVDYDEEDENCTEDFGVTRDRNNSPLYRSKQNVNDSQKAISSNSSNKSIELSKRAIYIRHYDPKTGKESVIRPVSLNGKVVEWDAIEGIGLISELDINNEFHDDAPLFVFSLENLCLPETMQISTGRFVSFCTAERNEVKLATEESSTEANDNKYYPAEKECNRLTENNKADKEDVKILTRKNQSAKNASHRRANLPVADKIIINMRMERAERRKMQQEKSDIVSNNIKERGDESYRQKHIGIIREISQSGRYGFIIDDASGASLFFHVSNALTPVHAGDRVEYEVRDIKFGKHAGKATCERICQLTETYNNSLLRNEGYSNNIDMKIDSTLQSNGQKQNNNYRKSTVDNDKHENMTVSSTIYLEDIDDFDLLDEAI